MFLIVTRFQRVAILQSPLGVERGLNTQFGVSEFGAVHAHGHRGSMFRLRDVLQKVILQWLKAGVSLEEVTYGRAYKDESETHVPVI